MIQEMQMDSNTRVTITDVEIPFFRLVVIFIKWTLAAIPAAIIVSLIMGIIMTLLAGVFGGMGAMMGGFQH
jgi:hypothetical protein